MDKEYGLNARNVKVTCKSYKWENLLLKEVIFLFKKKRRNKVDVFVAFLS